MSIAFTISKSGLKVSKHRSEHVQDATGAIDLVTRKPDLASLDDFASKVRLFRRRENNAHHKGSASRSNTAAKSEQRPGTATAGLPRQDQSDLVGGQAFAASTIEGPTSEALRSPSSEFISRSHTDASQLVSTKNSENPGAGVEHKTARSNSGLTVLSGPARTPTSAAKVPHDDILKSSKLNTLFNGDVNVGEGTSVQGSAGNEKSKSLPTGQPFPIQATKLASESSSISSKEKEYLRSARWKPAQVLIPRTALERIKRIKVAGLDIVKVEDAEFSAVNKEKLRNFTRFLASTKDQIELFGKELPLCRVSLVDVREGQAAPATYLCIQGLKHAADITRIHTAMSHKRYKKLYDPLKLCYETSELAHVTFSEAEASRSSQSSQNSTSRPNSNFLPSFPSAIPEYGGVSTFTPLVEVNASMQTFYQYLPVLDNKTYCGALSRTSIYGQTSMATLGGLVEVDGRTYLMTCQHGFWKPSPTTVQSLSDTLMDSDILPNSEGPLVFCSGDLPNGSEAIDRPDLSSVKTRLANLRTSSFLNWNDLSIGGAIRNGREWCLIPMEDYAILPNFIEKSSTKKGKEVEDLEICYLDDIAEPFPGNTSYIVTGSQMGCSGIVSANTSFMVGGGIDGFLEVWTINLDDDEGLQKGDSGSWVLDTSDPSRYKVLGSAIATSHSAAHFIRLRDQFSEMLGAVNGYLLASPSLTPTFRALVQCAHISFRRNDPSSEWFIEQAFLPRTLEQLRTGWYLPVIQSLLGVQNDLTKELPALKQWSEASINGFKGMLLRYGPALLDNICQGWIQLHATELSGLETKVVTEFANAVRPLFRDEISRMEQHATGLPELEARPPEGIWREDVEHIRGPKTDTARTNLPLHQPEPGAIGFLLTKKRKKVSPLILLSTIPMVGYSALAGIAASMVLLATERQNKQSYFHDHVNVGLAVGLGAVSGAVSTSPMAVQILLLYLSHKYNWHVYASRYSFTLPYRILSRSVSVGVFVVLTAVLSFARAILPTLYVVNSLGVPNQYHLIVASAAAAAPMLLSTASHPFYQYVLNRTNSNNGTLWALGLIWWLTSTGFDALAGYAFGRVAQMQGLYFIQPSSGAAAFGLFGGLLILWPILSCVLFGPCTGPVYFQVRRRYIS
ncbi:hypothetical protein HD806DRAFT_483329 [Xylariaceae sp. AK1471]|nr:hypothetical protein HD806DRAFT_483329 [Xylariaceae sp. AK1471]